MTHRWLLPTAGPPAASDGAGTRAGTPGALSALAARVLAARGLGDGETGARFLEPKLADLHNPSLLPGVDQAAQRILDALNARERIAIYGDYDVDGVCAAAILHHVILHIRPDADVVAYVPHRIDEGYGLNAEALRKLAHDGARLIVSVDCGVTAREPALAARDAGADLIITDHHNLPSDHALLPHAYAIVHPRLPGSAYPFGELCGAGVAFKLAWRLATLAHGSERVAEPTRRLLLDLLALAALGTIADIVPLLDENRVIARFGLGRLRSTDLIGLNALIEAADLAGSNIDAEQVGFVLGPRLNACGRMGHARDAVEMFTTATRGRALQIARELNRLNDQRRASERAIAAQAVEMAEAAGMTADDRRAIVLACEGWSPGVIGIVCSRLVERYHRPTLLLQRDNGLCQGSGRSIDGFCLHDALESCADLLDRFGGHDMAAGLAVSADRFDAFAERFIALANERLSPDHLTPSLRIDCDASLEELTPDAVRQLERLGPFGRSNPAPSVRLTGVRLAGPPEPLGAHGKHLALRIGAGTRVMRVVAWNWGQRRAQLHAGDEVELVVEPKISTWNARRGGLPAVEPTLKDLARRA
ncbi:MAG: single-stranded-DNA-specific exonuclease RecJ [Phycisphaerales bacterium]|nr:single-stranded-DNA-specific exonuclease RecJ [Phycisphaerales bacterium]